MGEGPGLQLTSIRHLLAVLPIQEALRQKVVGTGPVLGAVVQCDGAEEDGGALGQAVASDGGVSVQHSASSKGFICGEVSGMTGCCHAENQGWGFQEAVSQVQAQLQVVPSDAGRSSWKLIQACAGVGSEVHGRLTCCSPGEQLDASADPP